MIQTEERQGMVPMARKLQTPKVLGGIILTLLARPEFQS